MIVVDTNVISYLWLPSRENSLAERVLTIDREWAAPLLWRSEFRSVLNALVKRGELSLASAEQTAREAEAQMRANEFAVSSQPVLRAAASTGCSTYDCEFVVLAEQLGVPLMTADRQVLKAFPSVAVSLADFAARG